MGNSLLIVLCRLCTRCREGWNLSQHGRQWLTVVDWHGTMLQTTSRSSCPEEYMSRMPSKLRSFKLMVSACNGYPETIRGCSPLPSPQWATCFMSSITTEVPTPTHPFLISVVSCSWKLLHHSSTPFYSCNLWNPVSFSKLAYACAVFCIQPGCNPELYLGASTRGGGGGPAKWHAAVGMVWKTLWLGRWKLMLACNPINFVHWTNFGTFVSVRFPAAAALLLVLSLPLESSTSHCCASLLASLLRPMILLSMIFDFENHFKFKVHSVKSVFLFM